MIPHSASSLRLPLVPLFPSPPAASPRHRIASRIVVDGFLVDRLEGAVTGCTSSPAEISVTLDRPWEKHFYNGVR
ncbi:MAG: hypothetical protein Ct9H300mP1_03050 [Planctomycetaceae bacterium]|nr:MAG: hypothetical protein Ct9H300mP1_03050 [Planctomycetaceae bacterium]